MNDHGRLLRQIATALEAVDDRLVVLEVSEAILASRGEPTQKLRDEAARLNALRVRLLAKQRHYETHVPRVPHAQDFPETPAPFFAYRGSDPTANTAIANLTRRKKNVY